MTQKTIEDPGVRFTMFIRQSVLDKLMEVKDECKLRSKNAVFELAIQCLLEYMYPSIVDPTVLYNLGKELDKFEKREDIGLEIKRILVEYTDFLKGT